MHWSTRKILTHDRHVLGSLGRFPPTLTVVHDVYVRHFCCDSPVAARFSYDVKEEVRGVHPKEGEL